ncbi:vitamin K-dependent gamma-carboxylase isoform X2 [Cylas formicarius]|uniref:vitamin K-dependent gamma-carboxylase isoform X2 n=1 Tax=Cylas formicarius TaxID=197179 RepID=UPI00295859B1|nr:vitamin K-dependent gamma-carboxylase isoform X2 [Cylas formicarius]
MARKEKHIVGTLVRELLVGMESVKKLNYEDIVRFMYRPTDPSSLGVIRFLFGLLMAIDIAEERGGADIDLRWGNPQICHFPLIPILKPMPFAYMSLVYAVMWIGAVGVMLGLAFRISVLLFGISYWYLFLLDKSFWNNHSYLFGVVTILLMGSSANHFFSLDGVLNPKIRNSHVPYWNYFILKYQFFMLYFLAGLKKTDSEWLEGYSMTHLGEHWVFSPFRIVLSTEEIDYLVVHWFGFLLDLTIGFWMLLEFSRPVAMLFCSMFHLMNSRLFNIGMFPYVCLATMPLFCNENWPRRFLHIFSDANSQVLPSKACIYHKNDPASKNRQLQTNPTYRHKTVVGILLVHCVLQIFLPYSHFVTKGYNNWTNGLYGYSWDMMVHSWDTVLVTVRVVDNESQREHFLNSHAWTLNDRWNKHADMSVQYAHCVRDNLLRERRPGETFSTNISVYVDVWCSLNKRFQQRMYDPNFDLLKANWSPFKPVEWLKPVLSENDFRRKMKDISDHVYSWSNRTEVLFVADFPGLYLENYVSEDLYNVSITLLEGKVVFELDYPETEQSVGIELSPGIGYSIPEGTYHKVHTIGATPSRYMYTFVKTDSYREEGAIDVKSMYSPFPLIEDVKGRKTAFSRMIRHIAVSLSHILFGTSLPNFNSTAGK